MTTTKKVPPPTKAQFTGKWAETLFKALSARDSNRWKFISFRGTGGGESRGGVDVLALRKDHRVTNHTTLNRGDLFDIILVQCKGGSAKAPTRKDRDRLRLVKEHYHAREVVLFSWKMRKRSSFSRLIGDDWKGSTPKAIFG